MASKKELGEKLNLILGTTVNFEPMTKEDLEALLVVVGDPGVLARISLEGMRERGKKEVIDRFEKATRRPLREILKELQGEKEDKGLFGLGLLPRLLDRTKTG
jgi:hypothetical protein